MQQEVGLSAGLILMLVCWLAGWINSSRGWSILFQVILILNTVLGWWIIPSGTLFLDVFITDEGMLMQKGILTLGTILISMSASAWLKNHAHVPEFYVLMLASLLGMFIMISAGNMLMFYIGLELAAIPLAALAAFDLSSVKSAESSLKMILNSAFASGILLFGISIIYGTTGTLSLSALQTAFTGYPIQLLGFIFLFAGFAFKISVVPFHLWTADVYEGAPVSVTAFFSVVSKGAAVFVLNRWLYQAFGSLENAWYQMLFVTSILTMTVGNLFALRQNNIKRFLAFSSIAQAGYLLFGISACAKEGTASVNYFMLVYVFSNLGAFSVISIISALTGKEKISDFNGLHVSNPFLAWVLGISLFSLAGIPPTAGFFGKAFLITAGASKGTFVFLAFAALNLVVSLYYYLRVIRAVFVEKPDGEWPVLKAECGATLALWICLGGMILLGLIPGLYSFIFNLSFGM